MQELNVDAIMEDLSWIKEFVEPATEIEVSLEKGKSPTGIEYPVVTVRITGTTDENLGHMIGVQGQHLFSLQHILNLLLNKKYTSDEDDAVRLRVNLDIGDYRHAKSSAVERVALSRADDARILGDEIELEPMSSYDRMIVHSVLSKFDDIRTESRGEGPQRRVVIIPTAEEDLGTVVPEDKVETDELEDEAE